MYRVYSSWRTVVVSSPANLIVVLAKLFGTLTVRGRRLVDDYVTFLFTLTQGVFATSRHIPGVRFAGVSHPGLIGTAPSHELLATWNKREGELIAAHADAVPPVAYGPNPNGAYVGQDLPENVRKGILRDGARTIPGREHGGNCDVCDFYYCAVVSLIDCILLPGSLDQEPLKVRVLLCN